MKPQTAITQLNKLGHLLREKLKEQGIDYKPSEWQVVGYEPPNLWIQAYTGGSLKSGKIELPDTVLMLRTDLIMQPGPSCTIYLKDEVYEALIATVANAEAFSRLLQAEFFKNNLELSLERYLKLYAQEGGKVRKEKILPMEAMRASLRDWISGNNYSKTAKWGKMLDRLVHYLPQEVQEVPEGVILYRGILVRNIALRKLFSEASPLF